MSLSPSILDRASLGVSVGLRAYLFGYPLVLMEETRRAMTRQGVPMNHFVHVSDFPDHTFRTVVRPNLDTLYSSAWIDLCDGPLVLSVPDTGGRYYVMPFMDAWTNVFDCVGSRTTGTGEGNYVLVGPGWTGTLPEGLTRIDAPTSLVWLIGRIQTNGPDDVAEVASLQSGFTLTPLPEWPDAPNPGIRAPAQSSNGEAPSERVEAMSPTRFFEELCHLMGEQSTAPSDASALKSFARFGIRRGRFEASRPGALRIGVRLARGAMRAVSRLDRGNDEGWAIKRDKIGRYGTAYAHRAMVAHLGLGALPPEEAGYAAARKDGDGKALHGRHRYRIRFAANETPPVDAFWSLTLYGEDGFLVDNPARRYAIGDRDSLCWNADGSLEIRIQHESPGDAHNWLPAPSGPFNLILRLYLPKARFASGEWICPPVERID